LKDFCLEMSKVEAWTVLCVASSLESGWVLGTPSVLPAALDSTREGFARGALDCVGVWPRVLTTTRKGRTGF